MRVIWSSLLGVFVGFAAFVVVAIVVGVAIDPNPGDFFDGLMNFLLFGAPIGGGVWGAFRAVAQVSGEEERKREAQARRHQADVADAQRTKEQQRWVIVALVQTSAQAYLSLPRLLDQVSSHRTNAQRHFRNSAFSPFWSEIESAYGALARFNDTVEKLGLEAQRHTTLVQQFRRAYPGDDDLPSFPVALDATRATEAGGSAAEELEGIVYEAQRIATFAQIWEQRRTTAAVIVGFGNLHEAVERMAMSITSAVGSLEREVVASRRELGSRLVEVRGSVDDGAETQARQMRELTREVDEARRELVFQSRESFGHSAGGH